MCHTRNMESVCFVLHLSSCISKCLCMPLHDQHHRTCVSKVFPKAGACRRLTLPISTVLGDCPEWWVLPDSLFISAHLTCSLFPFFTVIYTKMTGDRDRLHKQGNKLYIHYEYMQVLLKVFTYCSVLLYVLYLCVSKLVIMDICFLKLTKNNNTLFGQNV